MRPQQTNTTETPVKEDKTPITVKEDTVRPRLDYKPEDQLYIPKKIEKAFLSKGYKLKYIRYSYTAGGEADVKNIRKRLLQGYQFVNSNDLKNYPEFLTFFDERNTSHWQGLLTIGDLALAKITVEQNAANKKKLSDFNNRQMSEVDMLVKQHGLKLQRKSSTSFGRKRNFADDNED
jgi:hypothetical protein